MLLLIVYLFISALVLVSPHCNHNNDIEITIADINVLHDQIRQAIDDSQKLILTAFEGSPPFIENRPLLATIIDLQWHDCAGPKESNHECISICDGCLDPSRSDFHGNLVTRAIEPVDIIYTTLTGSDGKLWKDKISRADFWATISTLSTQYAAELQASPRTPFPSGIPIAILPNIPFYFGRKDCQYSPFSNESSFQFPPLDRGFAPTFSWFDENFGFTKEQFIALMGVHTLGKGRRESSGFAHFWKFDDDILNNDYYVTTKDPVTEWKQLDIDNSEFVDIPDRIQWVLGNEAFLNIPPAQPFFERALRLNVDMSLYLKIEDNIDPNTGAVSCVFKGLEPRSNECPFQDSDILDIFNVYAQETNNQIWMNDFAVVWEKMVTMGWDVNQLKKIQLP